jgi:purine-binding chemotaxis protein CheW
VGAVLCALPVDQVSAVMRLLPIEPVAGAPRYLRGLAIIRGEPVPVVDVGLLTGPAASRAQRLVTIKAEMRIVALAVDEVIGVSPIAADAANPLPPLLHGISSEAITAIGALDSQLLVFLRTSRIVPEDVLARLDAQRARQ